MDDSLLQRYSRHILLDEIGIEGQRKICAAKAAIIGAGGLGCPAAMYLAAAGVGEIVIYDDDEVDLTNLQRQVLHATKNIGMPKIDSAKTALESLNPHCRITPVCERIGENNAAAAAECDVALDCTDNFASRHAVNRACARRKTPLVFGAASGFHGQTAAFDFRRANAPCYQCLFAEEDEAPEEPCALFGVFAPLAGIVGCLQAAAALKIIAMPETRAETRLLLIEAQTMEFREIILAQDPACPVCGGKNG
ncbi:MAG: HesA/MoeB/ThiF family protein [Gammaproteobacteria bacterium]